MDNIKFYLVGGAVRDKILDLKPKDLDYTVEAPSYLSMRNAIINRGGQIFLEQEQYLTIRAKIPVLGVADFVLARKDGAYTLDGRRPDSVVIGTLHDDLSRRDFTVNAIALDEHNNYIDPFNGIYDIKRKLIRCVGITEHRMQEDSLRMLRAIRFSITKEFSLDEDIHEFLKVKEYSDLLFNISIERIREELLKCFEVDTLKTLKLFTETYKNIGEHIFSRNIKLIPTIYTEKNLI